MKSTKEIESLLSELDRHPVDDLEEQDLDFKEWNSRSPEDAVALAVEMAVCMANGGGGSTVFGVRDKVVGRAAAIFGVPSEVDVNRLRRTIYDRTDPKLTPIIDELRVPEGTARLLIMHVYPGMPPYTDTSGRGKIRIGKECQPLTGTLRSRLMVETGETDFLAMEVEGDPGILISPSAMEQLRDAAQRERAANDLLARTDQDLLFALGLLRNGRLLRAGLLLVGKDDAIHEQIPAYRWSFLRMSSDTQYDDRMEGYSSMAWGLQKLMDRIMADNPITTLEHGLFHFEYRTYPEIAIREAMLNAFCHAEFRMSSPIMIKQFPDKLELTNPGGFTGGVTSDNILHHAPVSRNPSLVDALNRLRLINRSNLGIGRMFESLLVEGKEPPLIEEVGGTVRVTFLRREFSPAFRVFVAQENRAGRVLHVSHLLVLHHLLSHAEVDTSTAARMTQRPENETRDILTEMERRLGYLEQGGTGRGTYWSLHPDLHRRMEESGHPERDRRIVWDAAKTRILSVLMDRAKRGDPGLKNEEIRQIARLDRFQAIRLMRELMEENQRVMSEGKGKGTLYVFVRDIT